jgi:hypothetical protein
MTVKTPTLQWKTRADALYVIQGNNVMPGTAQVKAKSDDREGTLGK